MDVVPPRVADANAPRAQRMPLKIAFEDGIVTLDDFSVRRVAASAAVFDSESSSFVLEG